MYPRASKRLGTTASITLALATILSVPAARAQIADSAGATNRVLTLMNAERARNNVSALVRQCDLDTAATRHVNDMVAHNFLNHTGSDGSVPDKRAADAGYPSDGYVGENIFGGTTSTVEAAMAFWLSSPGHHANMVNANYTQVGIAYAFGANTQFKNYWCVIFGGGGGRQCAPSTPVAPIGQTRSLGGIITSAPAAFYDARYQRFSLFGRGSDGALWYRGRPASATAWDNWQSLQEGLKGNPAVGLLGGTGLAVFARGTDDAVWYKIRAVSVNAATGAVTDEFLNRISLGGVVTSDPVVASNAGGRLEVFARGTDNALWHNWQLDNGEFGGWASLGGTLLGGAAAGLNQSGRMSVFHRGTDSGLWVRTQLGVGTSSDWGAWGSIGGRLGGDPVVTRLADGRLAVFYRTPENTLVARWQNAPNASSWSNEAPLGSPDGGMAGSPSVVLLGNGRLQVFVRSSRNLLYQRASLTADPSAAWDGWSSLQFTVSQDPVAVLQPAGGSPSLFAVDGARAMWELLPR